MVMLTPDQGSIPDANEYGYSNDFMMPDRINDVADHPAVNLPIKKPKVKRNVSR